METLVQGSELSVAILMDDLASAKEIASALRQKDILAHHYQNLDEFWVSSNLQTPDLVIVDVTKMSQGTVQFRQHPKVQDKTMDYIFFSKDTTKVLLQSTMNLEAFGYIHHDLTLVHQVANLVNKKVQQLNSKKMIRDLEDRIKRIQNRSQRIISERSEAEEFQANFNFIKNFCSEVEEAALKQDFTQVLLSKLENWEAIEAYGVFELNQSGTKLISPEITKRKHHPFPSLWLGKENLYGIENFAQEMAIQVANDLFEIEPVCLKIHAGNPNAELLLFVSFREERMLNFSWDVFESLLSSSLRRLKLHSQTPQFSTQFMPMWETLDSMDKLQKMGVESETKVVTLSLIPLINVAKKRIQNKFFWSGFFNDFFLQLSGRINKTTKLSLFGPWHVMFFIPKEELESEFLKLQSFARQFGYWKFFEDNSEILTEEIYPVIKMIPSSSAHYLRLFEKEIEDARLENETVKLSMPQNKNFKGLSL